MNILCRIKAYIKKNTNVHICGKKYLYYSSKDYIRLKKNSKVILNGNLVLNQYSLANSGRPSLLRMEEDSSLECDGFEFSYGADIQIFRGAKLKLGKGSYINSDCKIRCHKEIIIGDNCAISHDFTIMDSDVHSINGNNNTNPIHIGNHVWIGTRVTILSGVCIGNGAVIAAGSLVKHNVPAGSLVGGTPARVLKENIVWEI